MNATELLSAVNEHCEMIGAQPVTERQLRDWVDEGLVPGAKALGRRRGQNPNWRYPENALGVVKRIAELRAQSIRRVTLLRAYLWIEGDDTQTQRMKGCILNEFSRFRRRISRTKPWDLDLRYGSEISPSERARAEKQLGNLTTEFHTVNLQISKQNMIEFASLVYWGVHEEINILEESKIINIKVDGRGEGSLIQHFKLGFVGFIGSPDYISDSGEDYLKSCNDSHLLAGRDGYRDACAGLMFLWLRSRCSDQLATMMEANAKALAMIQTPEFLISYIAVLAIGAKRAESV